MSLTEEEILEILEFFDASDFDHLHLELPDLKLSVGKAGTELTRGTNRTNPSDSIGEAEVQTRTAPPVAGRPTPGDEEGLVPITAPVLGVFYRAPKPGARPFVEVGQWVKENDTVCLIEVMKLFNSVKAGVRGRIARICVESSQMVEYGETLFLIEPMDEDPEDLQTS